MDMFNVKRRHLITFKDFLKASENANKTFQYDKWNSSEKSMLRPYMRTINRNPIFSHSAFDPTYDAMNKSKKAVTKDSIEKLDK